MTEWIISSSVLIIVIILLRRVLRGRISQRLQYGLWAIVLLRLLMPFSPLESGISVMNAAEEMPIIREAELVQGYKDIQYINYDPVEKTGTVVMYEYLDLTNDYPTVVAPEASSREFERMVRVLSARDVLMPLWLLGIGVMLAVFAVTNHRFGRMAKRGSREECCKGSPIPVFISENVHTPCLFGFLSPRIYLTPQAAEDETVLRHVLAHELTHYRHGDNIWALLRCICLAVHWYNPLVWLAALLSRRDAELACDEGAIKRLGEEERIAYGRTLLCLTCRDRGAVFVAATTMTENKRTLAQRVKLIAQKPRMAAFTLAAVIAISLLAAACTFTGALGEGKDGTEAPGGVSAAYVSMRAGTAASPAAYVRDAEKVEEIYGIFSSLKTTGKENPSSTAGIWVLFHEADGGVAEGFWYDPSSCVFGLWNEDGTEFAFYSVRDGGDTAHSLNGFYGSAAEKAEGSVFAPAKSQPASGSDILPPPAESVSVYDVNGDGIIQTTEFPAASAAVYGLEGEYALLYDALAEVYNESLYIKYGRDASYPLDNSLLMFGLGVYGSYGGVNGETHYVCELWDYVYYNLGEGLAKPLEPVCYHWNAYGGIARITLSAEGKVTNIVRGGPAVEWENYVRDICGPMTELADALLGLDVYTGSLTWLTPDQTDVSFDEMGSKNHGQLRHYIYNMINSAPEPYELQPPVLTADGGDGRVFAPAGSFDWTGESGVRLVTETHTPYSAASANALITLADRITLSFETEPDSVSIRRWGEDEARSEMPSGGESVSYENGGFALSDAVSYYEISVKWGKNSARYYISVTRSPAREGIPLLAVLGSTVKADLNGDGVSEEICVNKNAVSWAAVIKINGVAFDMPALHEDLRWLTTTEKEFAVVDIDRRDGLLEIVVCDGGPSSDFTCSFFRWDGESLHYIGMVEDYLCTWDKQMNLEFDGFGGVYARFRLSVLQTWYGYAEWRPDSGGMLQRVEREIYQAVPMSHWTNEGVEKTTNTVLQDLVSYPLPNGDADTTVLPAGSEVIFSATDNREWVLAVDETGKEHWLRLKNGWWPETTGGFVQGHEAFEGLNFAD